MITYLLAVVFFAQAAETPPQIIAPAKDRESCLIEARKRNKEDPQMQLPSVRATGAEYACLQIVRDYV
jgi:type IV secretory pathway VirD2 relaxase